MAEIIRDSEGNPIPQYQDEQGDFQPLKGGAAPYSEVVDSTGNTLFENANPGKVEVINHQEIITAIGELKSNSNVTNDKLDALTTAINNLALDVQVVREATQKNRSGLSTEKPAAGSVPAGTTYWSVDTDPNADKLEVSDGNEWHVIGEEVIDDPTPVAGYLFRFDASELLLNNNDKVLNWPDLSGNGNHITQSTLSDQPVYLSAGLNGKPTVKFDGNTFLERSEFSLSNRAGATTFAVMEVDNASSSSTIFTLSKHEDLAIHAYAFRISGSHQSVNTYINTWSSSGSFQTTISGNLYASSFDRDRGDIKMWCDGVASAHPQPMTDIIGSHDVLCVGTTTRPGRPEPYIGRLSELIYFDRNLTQQEIDDMNVYLMQKWGI